KEYASALLPQRLGRLERVLAVVLLDLVEMSHVLVSLDGPVGDASLLKTGGSNRLRAHGRQRQELFQILALTGRAGGDVARAHETFEFVAAAPALVLEDRH